MQTFENFKIIGADNVVYDGVRPGLIPKPFKAVQIMLSNGKELKPFAAKEKNIEDIIGFDCSIKMIADVLSTSAIPIYFYRIITLYNDGSKWSVLFDCTSGNVVEADWV